MNLDEYKFVSVEQSKEMIETATNCLNHLNSIKNSNSTVDFMKAYSNSLIKCHSKFIKETA